MPGPGFATPLRNRCPRSAAIMRSRLQAAHLKQDSFSSREPRAFCAMASISEERSASPSPSFSSLALLPAGALSAEYADVCGGPWPGPGQLPVVYHPSYNISFFGIERLHPFDSCKFGKVMSALKKEGVLKEAQTVLPREASLEVLADVHTEEYLRNIHYNNFTIVQVTELAPLAILPNKLLRWRIITPMKLHVGGTILAAGLALERGWAINVGGGMHHATSSHGMGWCPFDDIVLAVRRARRASGRKLVVLLIDLDAHQGNGVERDKLQLPVEDLHILDVYNAKIFPLDFEAKQAIDIAVELRPRAEDDEILGRLDAALAVAAATLPRPDLVVFNAGTDVLAGDPLGRLSMSPQGVVARDEKVWRWCRDVARAPVVMTLSGGYTRESAAVITASIRNLFETFDLGSSGSEAKAPLSREAPEATQSLEAPEAPEATQSLEAPEAPEARQSLEAPEAPEARQSLEASEAPEARQSLEASEAPEARQSLSREAPETTQSLEAPEAPEATQSLGAPETTQARESIAAARVSSGGTGGGGD